MQQTGGWGLLRVCALGPRRPSSTDTRHLWEGGCWGKASEKKKTVARRERERGRERLKERGEEGEWEACWCHICTKPIPATMVTWLLSPDVLAPLCLPQADTLQPTAYLLYKVLHKLKHYFTEVFFQNWNLWFNLLYSQREINTKYLDPKGRTNTA